MRSILVVSAAVAVLLVGQQRKAAAYPQYQFSSETNRCSECHYAPAGGGLLTEWGRSEVTDTLSLGGDGAFLHGVPLPSWLTLGGDLRLAALVNETGGTEGAEVAVFPMQLELAGRAGKGSWSGTVIAGLRGTARQGTDADDRTSPLRAAAFVSREHFVTWAPETGRWYARAGRFAAPFGLRLPDHTAFVRRYLGYGLYEETYGVGVGRFGDSSELHVTAFATDPLQWSVQQAFGGAALYEKRGVAHAWLGSARVAVGELDTRATAGLATKWWLESSKLLVMGEIDGGWQQLTDAHEGRPFAAAYVGPTWFPRKATSLQAAMEMFAEDARIPEVSRYALSIGGSVMPWAHVELALNARVQLAGPSDHGAMALFQLHYFP